MNLGRRGDPVHGGVTRRVAQARRLIGSGLVELVPVPGDAGQMRTPGRYVLRIGDVCLEFDDAVDAATLRRVLEVLRSC